MTFGSPIIDQTIFGFVCIIFMYLFYRLMKFFYKPFSFLLTEDSILINFNNVLIDKVYFLNVKSIGYVEKDEALESFMRSNWFGSYINSNFSKRIIIKTTTGSIYIDPDDPENFLKEFHNKNQA